MYTTKKDLLKFLEPFDDDIEIRIRPKYIATTNNQPSFIIDDNNVVAHAVEKAWDTADDNSSGLIMSKENLKRAMICIVGAAEDGQLITPFEIDCIMGEYESESGKLMKSDDFIYAIEFFGITKIERSQR